MINKVYDKIKKILKENYKFLITLVVLFLFFFYELPFVVYRPGGTIDLQSRITVETSYKAEGSLSMSYVSMMKGNIPFVLLSFVLPNWDLVKTNSITLEDESVDESIVRDHLSLEEGLDNAVISAYRLANKKIEIKEIFPVVAYITKEAQTDLKVGDILLYVNGNKFTELKDLQVYINSLEKDQVVHFQVLREEKELECTAKVYEMEKDLKVGISILNKYRYEVDPKIKIETKESESGSSGGLMTALAIYNALTEEDITRGKNIVGTGTISIDGQVGEIGGIKYKLLGAEKAHADLFLCPYENYEEAKEVKEKNKLQLNILPVKSLKDAVQILEK